MKKIKRSTKKTMSFYKKEIQLKKIKSKILCKLIWKKIFEKKEISSYKIDKDLINLSFGDATWAIWCKD